MDWIALDADSKLIISYLVGGRDSGYALEFLEGVKSRLANRVQLTTDEHKAYLEAMEDAFGGDVDYMPNWLKSMEMHQSRSRNAIALRSAPV